MISARSRLKLSRYGYAQRVSRCIAVSDISLRLRAHSSVIVERQFCTDLLNLGDEHA